MFPYDAVEGVLKGYDQLLNLVLDETVEYARGAPRMHASFTIRQGAHSIGSLLGADTYLLLPQTTTTC